MSNFDEEKENNDSPGIDLTRQVSFNSTSASDSNKPPVWAWFGSGDSYTDCIISDLCVAYGGK